MPLYAYQCNSCEYQFERQQSFSDDPVSICPECDESAVRRLISPVGVVFKGSGFYITDNRKSKNGKSSDKEAVSKTEKSETKSDESKSGESKSSDSKSSESKSSESSSSKAKSSDKT